MRRQIAVCLILAVLVLTALSMPTPTRADGAMISYNLTCSSFSATGTTTTAYLGLQVQGGFGNAAVGLPAPGGVGGGTINFPPQPAGTTLSIYVYGATDSSGSWDGHSFFVDAVTCHDAPLPQPLFTDGRENKNDAIQTAAVYCGVPNSGDVRVYALFNNVGYLAFTVTKAQLAAGIQKPSSPYLIKAGMGAELWRLQDGSLRIKRGTYVFDWPGC
jgi:hypothetical protein